MLQSRTSTINSRYRNIVPFLLGLFCCTNLIYVFKIGGTYVMISTFFSLLIVLYNFFSGSFFRKLRLRLPMNTRFPLLLFGASILLSGIPAVIYFINSAYLVRYLYGLIELAGYAVIALAVILCYDKKSHIKKGVAWGLIINVLVSCISIIQAKPGAAPDIYVALLKVFPQTISGIYTYGAYRPMGLFFESSYFIGFLIIAGFLLVPDERSTWKRYLYFFAIAFLIVYSGSGNILIAFACVLMFLFFTEKRLTRKVKPTAFLLGSLIVLGIGAWLFLFGGIDSFANAIQTAIKGGSLEESAPRWNNVLRILEVWPSVPIGCGWNMTNTYMVVYQGHLIDLNDTYTSGTSSFLLTLLMEVGVVGALSYCAFVGNAFFNIIKKAVRTKERLGIAIALLAMVLLQFLNGVKYFPHFMLVIGFAVCEASRIRNAVNE